MWEAPECSGERHTHTLKGAAERPWQWKGLPLIIDIGMKSQFPFLSHGNFRVFGPVDKPLRETERDKTPKTPATSSLTLSPACLLCCSNIGFDKKMGSDGARQDIALFLFFDRLPTSLSHKGLLRGPIKNAKGSSHSILPCNFLSTVVLCTHARLSPEQLSTAGAFNPPLLRLIVIILCIQEQRLFTGTHRNPTK